MKIYRVQIPATICFSIKAESPEAAIELAERVRDDNNENGWDVDLNLNGEELDDADGRAYLDEDAIRKGDLLGDCIIAEDDIEDPDEPAPPEQCVECGCSGNFNLLGVDVGGADRQAFVCDNCGHAHILD